ncbi:hypothetical protein IEQ34_019277 [Dendrobium chrysotoxum]|uniref:Uncharacterized protein n=1 Tax=Dendrobium chrysotoxum TaxID=161865 RepID=A0AAV7G874_DENCH|nr:hypothetical protein IEQ34_019277 [Dendrobium chrysotoxum]
MRKLEASTGIGIREKEVAALAVNGKLRDRSCVKLFLRVSTSKQAPAKPLKCYKLRTFTALPSAVAATSAV